jgi:hypothetical protein
VRSGVHGRHGVDERHTRTAGGPRGQPAEPLDGVSGAFRFSRTVASSTSIERRSGTGKGTERSPCSAPEAVGVRPADPPGSGSPADRRYSQGTSLGEIESAM